MLAPNITLEKEILNIMILTATLPHNLPHPVKLHNSLHVMKKIISHVESLISNVIENVHIFSDGMSSQSCSRFVLHFLTKIQLENITWHYNERGHGKNPTDGIGGTVKYLVFKNVKSLSSL